MGSRDAAETLRGAGLCVSRENAPLEPGEFYLVDLIGARVVVGDRTVGEVIDVRAYPSVDALVVRTLDDVLVEQPLLPQWVTRVDSEAKLVELASTEGFIA